MREGEGRAGGREGSYFADFLSTAAVWCVPFCLDCSVPSVDSINFKRKKKREKNEYDLDSSRFLEQVYL